MDFFIMLSSVMGIYANPSQSNYAAGCVFQDTLARSRSAQGLRGSVSFDIGYMRSVGYVSQRSADNQVIRANARKLVPIETKEFLEILDHYCDPALPSLDDTHSQLVIGARTAEDYKARGEEPVPATLRPLFAGFNNSRHQDAGRAQTDITEEADPSLLFQQAGSAEERSAVVTVALGAKVARALGVTADNVDPEKTLPDYGIDSLMAVELRSWMRKVFAADMTVFDMMGGKSIKTVGEVVVGKAAL
jgi:acyl carrier protein